MWPQLIAALLCAAAWPLPLALAAAPPPPPVLAASLLAASVAAHLAAPLAGPNPNPTPTPNPNPNPNRDPDPNPNPNPNPDPNQALGCEYFDASPASCSAERWIEIDPAEVCSP